MPLHEPAKILHEPTNQQGFQPFYEPLPEPVEKTDPNIRSGGTFAAGLRADNPVWNVIELLQRGVMQDDPEFKLGEALRQSSLWDTPDETKLYGAKSQEEFDFLEQRAIRQREDDTTLDEAGLVGLLARVVGGMISPTTLIPLTAGGKGLMAVRQGALLGTAASAIDEVPLFLNQPDRTPADLALGIGAGTVLGGVLGRASGWMSQRAYNKVVFDMAHYRGDSAIPAPVLQGTEGVVEEVLPQSGTYRVNKNTLLLDDDIPDEALRPFRELEEDVVDFVPQNLLVVNKRTRRIISNEITKNRVLAKTITDEDIIKWAKREGIDSIAMQGRKGDTTKIIVLDAKALKKAEMIHGPGFIGPVRPLFNDGVVQGARALDLDNIPDPAVADLTAKIREKEIEIAEIRGELEDVDVEVEALRRAEEPEGRLNLARITPDDLDVDVELSAGEQLFAVKNDIQDAGHVILKVEGDQLTLRSLEIDGKAKRLDARSKVVRQTTQQLLREFPQVKTVKTPRGKVVEPTVAQVEQTKRADIVSGALDELQIPNANALRKAKDELAALQKQSEKLVKSVAKERRAAGIPPRSASAAATRAPDAGMMKSTLFGTKRLTKWLMEVSPAARSINQNFSQTGRQMAAMLDTVGLRQERNKDFIPGAVGGTVQQRTGLWNLNLARGIEGIQNEFHKYLRNIDPEKEVAGAFSPSLDNISGRLAENRMGMPEFNAAIAQAMRNNDTHANEYVQNAARILRKEVYEPIWEEAKSVGMVPDDLIDLIDTSYLNRVYDTDMVEAHTVEFTEIITEDFLQKLEREIYDQMTEFLEKAGRQEQRLIDIQLPEEEVRKLLTQFEEELEALEAGQVPGLERAASLEETIAELKDEATSLKRKERTGADDPVAQARINTADEQRIKDIEAEIEQKERWGGDALKTLRSQTRGVKARLDGLNKAGVILEQKQRDKLRRVEVTEAQQLKTLRRAARQGVKAQKQLDRLSDKALNALVTRTRAAFAKANGVYERGEEKLLKLVMEDDDDMAKLFDLHDLQEARKTKVEDAFERVENAQTKLELRDEARAAIEESLDQGLRKINAINSRRAIRVDRLLEAARRLDPDQIAEQVAESTKQLKRNRAEFIGRLRALGADDIDLEKRTVSVVEKARADAEEVVDKILKTDQRLPGINVMQGLKGPTLARMLEMSSDRMVTRDGQSFLIDDASKLMRMYVRTMAPDIELARKFGGDPSAKQWFAKMNDERKQLLADVDADPKLSETKKALESKRINQNFKKLNRDLNAMIDRARHTRGLPENPDGIMGRMGRQVMNLNVLRMMGMVAVSSLPDMARPIMKYGLTRAFRDGFIPMITNLKAFRLSAREVRWAAGTLDPLLHTRAHQLSDVWTEDIMAKTSKFEQAVEFGTSRMGLISMFDLWTREMKRLSGTVANAKAMDSLDLLMNGKGTRKEIQDAQGFLAAGGINEELARKIWAQVNSVDGANRVNGMWYPNTEAWSNDAVGREAKAAYRALILGEVENTVVTPSIGDRPLISDANLASRMIFQFKSFAFSSTQKVVVAGLQERDMAALTGASISLALGAFSYYIYGLAVGGEVEERMRNASVEEWIDEAIARSGLTAVMGEVHRFAEHMPGLNDPDSPFRVTFAGRQTARRGAGSTTLEGLAGPSGDFISTLADVAGGIDEPTASTVHAGRRLTPLSNHLLFRRGYTAVEDAAVNAFNLPDRRQ